MQDFNIFCNTKSKSKKSKKKKKTRTIYLYIILIKINRIGWGPRRIIATSSRRRLGPFCRGKDEIVKLKGKKRIETPHEID
jgi:hypothetical protein